MGKYNTQLIPAYESPVVGGEGLGAGNLLEANQAKEFWNNRARMRRPKEYSVETHPRLELARNFLVRVPHHIPRVLALFPAATGHPNIINARG